MKQPAMIRPSSRGRGRAGFTVAEVTAALALLFVGLVVVAQVGVWVLAERGDTDAREAAQELAANVLESARAKPWEALTPAWAAAQRLPEPYQEKQWRLTVHVETEPSRPLSKRVTVEVDPIGMSGRSPHSVQLVGYFAARSAPAPGGKQ
jgi:hypothetical protein